MVEQAFDSRRAAGCEMLAGYAVFNVGDEQLICQREQLDFGDALHESVAENGLERMRPLGNVSIAPGAGVAFIPGGKHFMLMRPKRELGLGTAVEVRISTATGDGTTAVFRVEEETPPAFLRSTKQVPVQ